MKDPVYASVFKIREAIDDIKSAFLNGVDSWDRYNQLVGRGQGLQEALDIINEVLQEDEEDYEHRE